MRRTLAALALTFALPAQALGAPDVRALAPDQAPPAATLADVAWLEGRWVGEGLGGSAEETYAPPADGAMIGLFRSARGGRAFFYEFVVVQERAGSLVYRLKHFWPDGRAWEEKDQWIEFRLVAKTPGAIYFDGCTFERTGQDAMSVHVRIEDRAGGKSRIETFTYRRAR